MKKLFVLLIFMGAIGYAANEYKQPNPSIFYSTVTLPTLNTAGIVTNTSAGLLGTAAQIPLANGGTGTDLSGATNGTLPYKLGTAFTTNASNLFWDITNKRLGIGTSTPAAKVHNLIDVNTQIGEVIQGAGSQTADLFEAQESHGTALLRIDANGKLVGDGSLLTNVSASTLSGVVPIANGGTGQSSQLAAINALTQWNTSSVIMGSGASTNAGVTDSVTIGYNAGASSTNVHNVYIGSSAGRYATSANNNVFVGYLSGAASGFTFTGTANVGVGYGTLYNLQGATNYNMALGYQALVNVQTGAENAGIGFNTGAAITTGSNNTFIGGEANASSSGQTNSTAIGYKAIVGASNSIVLGATGANRVNVGIGLTSPSAALHVNTNSDTTLGIITQGNSSTQTADLFQAQNSNSTALLRIGSDGKIYGDGSNVTAISGSNISSGTVSMAYGGTGSDLSGASSGSIPYKVGSGFSTNTSNLFWDITNKELGVGTVTPSSKLTVSPENTSLGLVIKGALSQTADLLQAVNNAGTIMVRIGADGKIFGSGSGITGVTASADSWSGYHDGTCSFSRGSSTYGDPTADATCTLTQLTNNNFGSVTSNTSGGNKLPGIIFTPNATGTYLVCAIVEGSGSSSINTASFFKLWDGTTIISQGNIYNPNVAAATVYQSVSLCGLYSAASTTAKTLTIQTRTDNGNAVIINNVATTSAEAAIEWTIVKVN